MILIGRLKGNSIPIEACTLVDGTVQVNLVRRCPLWVKSRRDVRDQVTIASPHLADLC